MLLTDVRPFATTVAKDGFWANVLDPGVAFGARTYGTVDRLVVEVEGVRWAVESDGAEASCRRVRTRPDLVTDRPSLGALLFGGVRPSQLARGRRLEGRSDDALRRADAFFVVGPAPHCATWF
jgi:predicted acetyltransferase